MRIEEELEMVMEMVIGDGDRRNSSRRAVLHPSPFPLNLSLVLRLSVSYLISPNIIIAPDKDYALILIIVLDRATLQPLL